jgi:hypothetical protein
MICRDGSVAVENLGRLDGAGPSFAKTTAPMFVFFSNRLGCAGSIVVSVLLSLLLIFILRSCNAGVGY